MQESTKQSSIRSEAASQHKTHRFNRWKNKWKNSLLKRKKSISNRNKINQKRMIQMKQYNNIKLVAEVTMPNEIEIQVINLNNQTIAIVYPGIALDEMVQELTNLYKEYNPICNIEFWRDDSYIGSWDHELMDRLSTRY